VLSGFLYISLERAQNLHDHPDRKASALNESVPTCGRIPEINECEFIASQTLFQKKSTGFARRPADPKRFSL
jgi:hypothetical protein